MTGHTPPPQCQQCQQCQLSVAGGNWVVLRVSDPSLANAWPGPSGHPCNDFGVAYTSPWWIRP